MLDAEWSHDVQARALIAKQPHHDQRVARQRAEPDLASALDSPESLSNGNHRDVTYQIGSFLNENKVDICIGLGKLLWDNRESLYQGVLELREAHRQFTLERQAWRREFCLELLTKRRQIVLGVLTRRAAEYAKSSGKVWTMAAVVCHKKHSDCLLLSRKRVAEIPCIFFSSHCNGSPHALRAQEC